jgi:hypothetical protein
MALRAALLPPFVIQAPITAAPIFADIQSLDGFWIQMAVRTMGGDAWVGVGTKDSQASLMYYANDFFVWDVPPGYVLNFADFWMISSGGNAVLEITGMRSVEQPSGLLPPVVFPSPITGAL